ncbi:cytochrome b562 [Bdellovibrio svalbardensis]|uniref:Cytochrome b562 n=1 Tax=Bdellovibrio svalbardensis TaxID=2972972 RepID=A0ABT6DPZ8_9BACT|nr:cytochrome b562 [Bdellovibrio svalbardensis]MDG0817218.1 cytochrome b562 [Bdellovibrio svalbardensis]
MRRLFIVTMMALLLPAASFAQDASSSLKQNMKQIGSLTKQIVATVKDSSKDQDNANKSAQLVALFQLVYNQAADGVQDIPADQQQAAIEDFQNLIQQEIDLATQLQAAFASNDTNAAATILQQMNDIKHEGHDKYNP